jgi:ABC-type branched-subunit amino acid transport system ATPase component
MSLEDERLVAVDPFSRSAPDFHWRELVEWDPEPIGFARAVQDEVVFAELEPAAGGRAGASAPATWSAGSYCDWSPPTCAFQRKNKAEIKEDIERVYSLFPRLAERRSQKGGTLSGGEQQMCAMGRALMARPKLLMLDEPSLGLAPIFVEKIFEIVGEINEPGTTVLLVEQNALMALDASRRGNVLETGRVVLTDDAKNLRENEQVQRTYLGVS